MLEEAKRAIQELGMAGVVLFVGPTAKPPDMPFFDGLYRLCEEMGAIIWMHPCRPQFYADYDAYKVCVALCCDVCAVRRGGAVQTFWYYCVLRFLPPIGNEIRSFGLFA